MTRRRSTTGRRDGGTGARIEPLAHADAKSEVLIARIVADRPGAVYSPPVLRLGDHILGGRQNDREPMAALDGRR